MRDQTERIDNFQTEVNSFIKTTTTTQYHSLGYEELPKETYYLGHFLLIVL